jgi:putative membrane protein
MRQTIAIAIAGAVYAAAAVLLAPVAWAQGGNPAFANPATEGIETGQPKGDTANASDQVFLRAAAIGNRAEIELAKLAAERGSSSSIKEFADRMQADHDMMLDQVQNLARATNTPLPEELDADHQAVMKQLQSVETDAFDVEYIRAQIADHQRAAKLLEYQIGSGQSDRVRDFAKESLPTVMDHLAMARQIHAQLTGAAP